jgi:glycosyltransferase involved in cell wall biosynthesis
MKVSIFLICYNEEVMLPHTLQYYKGRFPDCDIYLVDNMSTDRSCDIAKEQGCTIVPYDSKGQHDEGILIQVRSHIYKSHVQEGWVIVCDMDEWLDMTEKQLIEEDSKGVTVITTQGVNMVGEAKTVDLSDIVLTDIQKGYLDDNFSKRVCFKYPAVSMEYWYGAHKCWPIGHPVFSSKTYYLKHYSFLGEEYLVEKNLRRHARNASMRQQGMNIHYYAERETTVIFYNEWLNRSIIIGTTSA